jgi:hypothetical protein
VSVLVLLAIPWHAAAVPLQIKAKVRIEVRTEVVPEGRLVKGVVVDDADAPVAFARVHLAIRGLEDQWLYTDREGRFEVLIRARDLDLLEHEHGARLPLSAELVPNARYAGARQQGQLELRREATWLEVKLEPEVAPVDAKRVLVRTQLMSAGGPVKGAPVRLQVSDGPELYEASDGQGRVVFLIRPSELGAGRHPVRARFAGDARYARSEAVRELALRLPTQVTLRVGREGHVATGRYRFSGRLIDAAGPIPGATVAILVREGVASGGADRAGDGPLGEQVALTSTDANGVYLAAVEGPVLFEGKAGRLDIHALYRPTDEHHFHSVSKELVSFQVPAPPGVPLRWYLAGLLWAMAGVALAQVARHRLWSGLWGAIWARRWVGPADPDPLVEPPFVVALPTPPGTRRHGDRVAGQVVDAHTGEGLAAALVRMEARDAEAAPAQARTKADGGFAIGPLGRGSYELQIDEPGYLVRELPVAIPHDGSLDGVQLNLVSVRARVRDLYLSALKEQDEPMRWGLDTPREGLARLSGARGAGLLELRAIVERCWFGPEAPSRGDAERAHWLKSEGSAP